jgi:hypothetical protein
MKEKKKETWHVFLVLRENIADRIVAKVVRGPDFLILAMKRYNKKERKRRK